MGERLGAVRELVEDDPAAERAAGDPDERELEERPLQEAVRPRVGERVQHSVVVVGGGGPGGSRPRRRRAGDRDDRAAVGLPRAPRGRASSAGGPNATWRRFRHSTRSQARAWSTSCVAIRIPRPSAASSPSSRSSSSRARLVDAGERLVEEQDRRVLDERAGDEHALALAAGELAELRARERRRGRRGRARRARDARLGAARPPPPGQARERPHQRDVERGDRVVEPRALGLRHVAEAACGADRAARPASSSPSSARKSVDLPPPFGPSTPIRSPGLELERDALEHGRRRRSRPRARRRRGAARSRAARSRAPPVKPRTIASAFARSIER